jgi:hypothetical protein
MYRKSRRTLVLERKRQRCAAMRAAKERKRTESCADKHGGWPLVRSVWLAVYAAPDGRHLELHAASERGQWVRCGSVRAVRGALAKLLWRLPRPNAVETVQARARKESRQEAIHPRKQPCRTTATYGTLET